MNADCRILLAENIGCLLIVDKHLLLYYCITTNVTGDLHFCLMTDGQDNSSRYISDIKKTLIAGHF